MSPVIRIAVPCFYMISGYFLYRGISQKEVEKAWEWVKKSFFLALVFNLFYLLIGVISSGYYNGSFIKSLIFGGGHLWYLTALWQGLLLFMIIRKCLSSRLIYFLPLLCLINLLVGRYFFIFDSGEYTLSQHIRLNCIAVALPYISLGYILRKHIHVLLKVKGWLFFLLLSLLFIYTEEYVLETNFINNTVSYLFFTLPLSLCCFLVCLKEVKSAPLWVIIVGKKHSANIYYFHPFISIVVGFIFGHRLLNVDVTSIQAIIVFVLCIIFSAALLFFLTIFGNLVKRTMN